MSITQMTVNKRDLTQAALKQVLSYDPSNGYFLWVSKHPSKRIVLNTRAGSLDKSSGYRSIKLYGHKYPEAHLACLYMTGEFPKGQMDHEDHVRDNNAWSNLKDVTFLENMRNRRTLKHTITGHQGIWYNPKTNRYIARIRMNGKSVYQSKFTTANQAIEAREAKLKELGFHDNHGSEH